MHIKTTMWHCYILSWIVTSKIPSVGEDVEKLESSYIVKSMYKLLTTLKNNLTSSLKLKIHLLYNVAILLLCMYPSIMKIYIHTNICI